MGNYSLGMKSGSSCGCGPSDGGASGSQKMIVNGLTSMAALDSDLIIDQGTTQEMLMCFTNGVIGDEVSCINDDATLIFSKERRPCYKIGDTVRLVGFDNCVADAANIFKVVSDATLVNNQWQVKLGVNGTGPDPVVVFSKLEFLNKQYCFTATSTILPLGCVQKSTGVSVSAPRLLMHVPADDLVITGAVFMRNDYFTEFGVTFEGGMNVTATNAVIGRVKAGDYILSTDAGISTPIKVVEVRSVEVMKESGNGTEFIERWTLEKSVLATECALIQVRRGLSLDLEVEQDGDCWRIIIPGGDTAKMQFPEEWRMSQGYYVGHYTISASWATLRNGKLAPRSEVIRGGNAYVRPSHMFAVPKM